MPLMSILNREHFILLFVMFVKVRNCKTPSIHLYYDCLWRSDNKTHIGTFYLPLFTQFVEVGNFKTFDWHYYECSWISVNLKHPSHFLRIISTWQGLHDTYRHRAGCSIRGCKDTFNLLKTLLLYNPRLCQYDLMWQIFLRYITLQFYI